MGGVSLGRCDRLAEQQRVAEDPDTVDGKALFRTEASFRGLLASRTVCG